MPPNWIFQTSPSAWKVMVMKKVFFPVLFLAILIFILSACEFIHDFTGGKPTPPITDNVNVIVPDESDTFEYDEIVDAYNIVIENFSFPGCELLDIWYDESFNDKEIELFTNADKRNTIYILSNFYVYPKGAHQSFNEDSTYTDWSWLLTREDEDSPWEIVDYGVL